MLGIMHAADRLLASSRSTGSIACVGLDPRPNLIPPSLVSSVTSRFDDPVDQVCAAFAEFNAEILRAVAGACAVVKPQAACYEAYGWRGWRVLADTVELAQELGIPVIVDAKRSDIGSTAVHYREAVLTAPPGFAGTIAEDANPGLQGDWITINPYLGADSVAPLIGDASEGKGAFVLVRTSNPGAVDFQDQRLAPDASDVTETLSDVVAAAVNQWGHDRKGESGMSDVGAVVGATWPDEARRLRSLMPESFFLVPGYGAQGGTAATAVAGARADGTGLVVNSSRGIIGAWQNADGGEGNDKFGHWAREALDAMNIDLNQALEA